MRMQSRRSTSPTRLITFSDAVFAVIITLLAIRIEPPPEASLSSVKPMVPILLVYVLSFVFIGIYWNNHHHLLWATERISGGVMWANLHLLFWLSLIPIITEWVGKHPLSPWPVAVYGIIGATTGIAYFILSRIIIRINKGTGIESMLGADIKGIVSEVLYIAGAALAFVNPLFSYALYATVSIMWIVPDPRLADQA